MIIRLIGRAAGYVGDWALNALAPLEARAWRHATMQAADFDEAVAEAFLTAEAERDVWEPDELFAARWMGEHPDIDPRAVITGRRPWFSIGTIPDSHAAAGSPRETPGDGEARPPSPVAGHPKPCRHCGRK